jgi:hypothetical protein
MAEGENAPEGHTQTTGRAGGHDFMYIACLFFRYLRQKASPYPGTAAFSSLISKNHPVQSA